MRYERQGNQEWGREGLHECVYLRVRTYLEAQMDYSGVRTEITNDGMVMKDTENRDVFAISNEGYVVIDMATASRHSQVVSTFFREVLGKNLLVIWRRGNFRAYIYPEGSTWRECTERYARKTIHNNVAIFDLLLKPVSGLKRMNNPRRINPQTGKYDRITTSEW